MTNEIHLKGENGKKIFISGMRCVSCETLISESLKEMDGVNGVKVDLRTQTATLEFGEKKPDLSEAVKRIQELGYTASLDERAEIHETKTSAKQWFISIAIVLGLYLIYKWFNSLGVLNGIILDTTNLSYGMAFLIGIVASMSTCLAVVGAVVVSFAARYQASGNFYQKNIKPHLMFHAGRWGSFFILGAALGYIGSWINISNTGMAWFTIVISIILVWLGLNILGAVPSLSTIGIRTPKKATEIWNNIKKSEHPLAPVVLGAFSFFLPCGFTQSMQLFAVSSGSAWIGGITMLVFAIGTTPVLFGLGVATTRFSHMKNVVFQKAVGFIVVLFALYTLSSGMAVLGISLNPAAGAGVKEAAVQSNQQVIEMTVDYNGFTPSVFKLKRGLPVRWIINGKQISGCTSQIIVPSLKIEKKLSPGENIVEFTPMVAGTISFSCWMGMVRGQFIIEDEDGSVPVSAKPNNEAQPSGTCSLRGSCGVSCGQKVN